MMTNMTSMERVLTALSHKEPDRVPFFLLLTLHGAKELGVTIEEYFSRPDYITQGQIQLREKYQHDCYYTFTYAALEVEAFGGAVQYIVDGPPNAGSPIIEKTSDIRTLEVPVIRKTPCLQKVLEATENLKQKAGGEVPIIGVVMSPFSLPVMQMGFASYLDLLLNNQDAFWKLMAVNEAFCVRWANAQLAAGATAICYFDPVSSPAMVPPHIYKTTGQVIAKRTIAEIAGPVATHFASSKCLNIIEDVVATGTVAIGVGEEEKIEDYKKLCHGRMSVIGNLSGIEMARWTPEKAQSRVQELLLQGASGGGFILADGHGEIPWNVSSDVLMSISTAVRRLGVYGGDLLSQRQGL